MQGRDNSKNLTVIEFIIIVLICLFLLAIVPPAFQKSRSDDFRITCARNLFTIGKAMLIYANDYDDEFPRAGGRNSWWTMMIPNWKANNRFEAYGLSADGSGGQATITSSFYLLAKYAELSPRRFVCPGDSGATVFNINEYGVSDREYIDLWDFGPVPSGHCSYSYHMPYGSYALTTSNEPGMAVAADRNPWITSPGAPSKDHIKFSLFNPDGAREAIKKGNSMAHKEEGQNVLFLDCHVAFEESACCGVNDDNIYTFWFGGDIRRGSLPVPFATEPRDKLDSYLVTEPATYRATITKEVRAVDSSNLKKTSVVATLDCPIPEHKNVIWCSTFQIAWNKLKNDIIGEPVTVPGAEELAARLNQAQVSETDLEKDSFYATAGIVKYGIIEEILKNMKKRFPSEPAPIFEKSYIAPDAVVTYSYLNVDSEFKYPFFTNNKTFFFEDTEGTQTKVTSFCNASEVTSESNLEQVCEQVDILYYKSGNSKETTEFAIDLCKHTNPYQVVLALVPRRNTLGSTVDTVEKKISEFKENPDYEALRKLRLPRWGAGDIVIVPDILYKLTHQFKELKDRPLGNKRLPGYFITEAKQMVDFSLSKTGVTLKSEAFGVVAPFSPTKPRHLYFNKPFLIYVKKRQGGTEPFFVMWVDNAELMQEFGSK